MGRTRSLLERLLRVRVLLARKVLVLPVLLLFPQVRIRRRRRVRHSIIRGPEGEYRPADFYGPAQNVPKPKTEEGYTNASLEGMHKTVQAWTEWRNYGMQTGDYSEARKFISKDFKDERDTYDLNAGLYKEGGWMIGGDLRKYEFHGEPINQGNGKYEWKFFVAWPYYVYVDSDGKTYKKIRNEDYENNWFMMTLHHDGNRWLIDNVHSLAIEKK